jgi:DNA-binding NtrC family response regulator
MKIALVEDNQDLCDSWLALFELDGHQVKTFPDGTSLLRDASAIDWCDVVITDYYLPDVNGMELIGQVRNVRDRLPVILLSGMRDRSVIETVRQMPRTEFVPKPADVEDLEAALDRVAAMGDSHRQSGARPHC